MHGRFASLVAALLLAVACLSPALAGAQVSAEPAASVGYGEGLRAGNVVLVMDGGVLSAFGLTLDVKTGAYAGSGTLEYNRAGVVFPSGSPVDVVAHFYTPSVEYCSPVDRFLLQLDAYTPDGQRVLTTSLPTVVDPPTQCPSETLTARVGDVGGSLSRYKKLFR